MHKIIAILIAGIFFGCDTTHKLTGTNYIDLEVNGDVALKDGYPASVIEQVGWNSMTSERKENQKYEELRLWLSSSIYPGNLFKFSQVNGDVEGQEILYWAMSSKADSAQFIHATMKYYLQGICSEFFTTDGYGYCMPNYTTEPDWTAIYSSLEARNFWQLQDGSTDSTNKEEQMYVQMRLGNYYRDYTHQNPEAYANRKLAGSITGISYAVRGTTRHYQDPATTHIFRGITNGEAFTLCDSSEVWRFNGDLNKLLSKAGIQVVDESRSDKAFYYVTVKGSVLTYWYTERAKGSFDRRINPTEIYNIRPVTEISCPDK